MPTAPSDPNELLRLINQTTTQTYHWIRAGVIVIVLLVIVAIIIG